MLECVKIYFSIFFSKTESNNSAIVEIESKDGIIILYRGIQQSNESSSDKMTIICKNATCFIVAIITNVLLDCLDNYYQEWIIIVGF
jgi:hypothetical protein